MEIRAWENQQLVLPTDMNGLTSDMYQRCFDYNHFAPLILWGLTLTGISGNTVAFSPGAARCDQITVASYPFLPAPEYGTGYPGIIEIPSSINSITLNTAMTPSYIVATYTISPTSVGQTLYTITGQLSQVTSVTPATQVILGYATYSGTWTVDQTPGTHRNYDAAGLSAIQYNLTTGQTQIGSPQGLSGTAIVLTQNTIANNNVTITGSLLTNTGYLFNPQKTDVATTVTAINALTSSTSMVRFTGTTATTVNGVAAGISAQKLSVYNQSSANVTFVNLSGSAVSGNKILLATGSTLVLAPGYCLNLIYDNTAGNWVPNLFTY